MPSSSLNDVVLALDEVDGRERRRLLVLSTARARSTDNRILIRSSMSLSIGKATGMDNACLASV